MSVDEADLFVEGHDFDPEVARSSGPRDLSDHGPVTGLRVPGCCGRAVTTGAMKRSAATILRVVDLGRRFDVEANVLVMQASPWARCLRWATPIVASGSVPVKPARPDANKRGNFNLVTSRGCRKISMEGGVRPVVLAHLQQTNWAKQNFSVGGSCGTIAILLPCLSTF